MIVIGIDPGIAGAIAILGDDFLSVVDMPILQIKRGVKTKSLIDARSLLIRLNSMSANSHAFVEIASVRTTEGVASSFTIGRNYQAILDAVSFAGIPVTEISSKKWKNTLGVPADKDGARFRASQLLPTHADQWPLKKHDGRAEAALIALYGRNCLHAADSIKSMGCKSHAEQ